MKKKIESYYEYLKKWLFIDILVCIFYFKGRLVVFV